MNAKQVKCNINNCSYNNIYESISLEFCKKETKRKVEFFENNNTKNSYNEKLEFIVNNDSHFYFLILKTTLFNISPL